uniref:Uncharacterized protein n=1 Tax=Rhizophora mucronata TaxID=61149 RepID=A0A2P2PD83_RHIMU
MKLKKHCKTQKAEKDFGSH